MENIVRIGNQFVLQPEFFNDSSGKYHEYSEDKLLDLVQQVSICSKIFSYLSILIAAFVDSY